MKVLVLSGTGFIGRHAIDRITERGHEVTVFHRGRTHADFKHPVDHIHGDRTELEKFVSEFKNLQPDVILDMYPRNQADGETLVRIFRGIAGRLVIISSGDVYRAYDRFRGADPGPTDPMPLTEESPLRDRLYPYRTEDATPDEPRYSYDKILMERASQSCPEELPATSVRLPMVYGPGDDQHRTADYLRKMDDNRPFILLPEDIAPWRGYRGYVLDSGEAIALCVIKPEAAGKTYHVGEASTTEEEWVRRIGRAAGWSGEIVKLPNDQLPESLRHDAHPSQHLSIDSSKIRRELGYAELTDPEEAMRLTVEWERANPKPDAKTPDYAAEDDALLVRPVQRDDGVAHSDGGPGDGE